MSGALNKHFIIAEKIERVPGGWTSFRSCGWSVAHGPDIRRLPVVDEAGAEQGFILGWLISENGIFPDGHPVAGPREDQSDTDWSGDFCGRFVYLLGRGADARFHLDAGGLLGAVYSPRERRIASIPSLASTSATPEIDTGLTDLFGIPQRSGWYPFGLTPIKGISRLLPNFSLHLDDFRSVRTWPRGRDTFRDHPGAGRPDTLYEQVAFHAGRLARLDPVAAHLTAGYDSRMVLAALWPVRSDVRFVTIGLPSTSAKLDVRSAKALAQRFDFTHETRPYLPATPSDLTEWHHRTGSCVSDAVGNLSRTLASWDDDEVQIGGVCGEVARAFYWTIDDIGAPPPTEDELLRRLGAPISGTTREAAKTWLESVPPVSTPMIWDLAYIEQRLGCWAGPAPYGSTQAVPSLSPFNSRRIFHGMLSAAETKRVGSELALEFIAIADRELATMPFNAPTGSDRLRFPREYLKSTLSDRTKKTLKRLAGR